jgi:hypothetical protein
VNTFGPDKILDTISYTAQGEDGLCLDNIYLNYVPLQIESGNELVFLFFVFIYKFVTFCRPP